MDCRKRDFGNRFEKVDYGPFYLYLINRTINGKELLFIMLADHKDKPKLLKSILEEFIEKNQSSIAKLASIKENIGNVDEKEVARLSMELESSLTDIINDHIGTFEVTARRDFASLIMGFFSGLLVYGIVLGITYLLNKAYHFIPKQEFTTFFAIVVLLDFLFPSIMIGFFSGSFKNAVISSLLIGPIVIATLSLIWWEDLISIVECLFKITNPLIVVGIILAGFVIGAALGIYPQE